MVKYIPEKSFKFSNTTRINYVYKKLQQIGCTYLSYTLIYPDNSKIRFTTDLQWQAHFLKNNLVSYCPLTYLIEVHKQKIVYWNKLAGMTNKQKEVMLERESYNFYNGISISQQFNNHQEVVVLATDTKKYDLAMHLIEKEFNNLKKHLFVMRAIAHNKKMAK